MPTEVAVPSEGGSARTMQLVASAIGGSAILLVVISWFLAQFTLILTFGSIVVAAGCALIAVEAGDRPRSRRYVIQATIMGALAGLAPLSLVVFYRLSYFWCPVVNTLSLPWPEPWREIAHWGAGLIWLASTAFLVVALGSRQFRRAAIIMWAFSFSAIVPTLILMFLTVYGDPGPYCVPG